MYKRKFYKNIKTKRKEKPLQDFFYKPLLCIRGCKLDINTISMYKYLTKTEQILDN